MARKGILRGLPKVPWFSSLQSGHLVIAFVLYCVADCFYTQQFFYVCLYLSLVGKFVGVFCECFQCIKARGT